MKRGDEDHYEKAKCVLVFTDLWLSPEVTAFDVAGWATSIPSWGVIHYREVEAKPPPPPPPVPRVSTVATRARKRRKYCAVKIANTRRARNCKKMGNIALARPPPAPLLLKAKSRRI